MGVLQCIEMASPCHVNVLTFNSLKLFDLSSNIMGPAKSLLGKRINDILLFSV